MNNVHYMVRAVEGSEALGIVGPDWLEAHRDLVEQAGEQYQALAWGPLLQLLAEPGAAGRPPDKAAARARWRDVNAALALIHESQSAWTIPDVVLRANMKDAILEDVLPLYEARPRRRRVFSQRPARRRACERGAPGGARCPRFRSSAVTPRPHAGLRGALQRRAREQGEECKVHAGRAAGGGGARPV